MHPYLAKRHFVTAIILILPFLLSAQKTGTIKGLVTDAKTNGPLPSANIVIQKPFLGTITDLNGSFILSNVPAGNQTLTISYMGYLKQEINVEVEAEGVQTLNVDMEVFSIMGNEVSITVQASGQRAAINQQFAALSIKNVVSSEKMEELPESNAAEAIGRLPGISLKRNSGEAEKVIIRGLSSRYNNITIEGFRMSSTNDFDRSVDLSMIQSELLSGIEVTKSLTPDMDADALGGTVNLRFLEASDERKISLIAEGGYANIGQNFGNYKFIGGISDRFFDKRFGVSLKAAHERKQMPSHRFNAGYSSPDWQFIMDPDDPTVKIDSSLIVRTQNATLIDRQMTRNRTNASLVLDYRTKWWEGKFINLISIKNDDVVSRDNLYSFASSSSISNINYELTIRDEDWETLTRTHIFQNSFRFGRSTIDLDLSYNSARMSKDEQYFIFQERNDYQLNQNWLIYKQPMVILDAVGGPEKLRVGDTFLTDLFLGDQALTDISYDVKLDYRWSFNLGKFSGLVQLGGKYHQLARTSDGTSMHIQLYGDYGRIPFLKVFPEYAHGPTTFGISAGHFLDENYQPGRFLNGRYKLGWTANIDTLSQVHDEFRGRYGPGSGSNKYWIDGIPSYQKDYHALERLVTGYVMTKVNLGKRLMLLPGVRYEKMDTEYQAWQLRESNNATGIDQNTDYVVTTRTNFQWFPSFNMKYKPTESINIQGAVYKSTTRPGFQRISPYVIYDTQFNLIFSNQPWLKPARAWNYDLGFSVMKPKIGLLTLNIFYKEINDLVFVMKGYKPAKKGKIVGGPEDLDDRILGEEYFNPLYLTPNSWTNLPVNNPEKATVLGLELSWQTNFWYLPGALKGLVLDVNYTVLYTSTKYPYFKAVITDYDYSGFIPLPIYSPYYKTRSGPMEDQPDYILNVILGWDFKGFSSRISYRYQSKTVEHLDAKYSIFDSYYSSFTLIDLMLKQKITKNISCYANLTNIGNHIDDYYFGEQGEGKPALPASSQYYGFRAQLGIMMNF